MMTMGQAGAAAKLWCEWCGEVLKLPEDGRPVHSSNRKRLHPDGHVVAAVSSEPPLWKDARELEAEFCGVFKIVARFGVLRADWAEPCLSGLAEHYEADDRETLARELTGVLAGDTRRMQAIVAAGGGIVYARMIDGSGGRMIPAGGSR
jgi:hypothetical protein